MNLTFKGQLFSTKYILKFAIILLILLGAFSALYYFKGYDILFQYLTFVVAGPVSLMMLFVPLLLLSVFLAFLFTTSNMPKQVSISLNDEDFKIEYGDKKISLALKDISHLLFVKRNSKWDRITLKTNKVTHINIGTLFSGVESSEIDALLARLKSILTKKYQLHFSENAAVKNNYAYTFSKYEPIKARRKLLVKIALFLVVFFTALIAFIVFVVAKKEGNNLPHAEAYSSSVFATANGKVYALKIGDGYFELKDADIKTFKPLVFGNEHGTLIGRDVKNIFASDQKIEGIDVKTAKYLGLSYIKDAKNVFYKTLKIPDADVSTFQSLIHSAGFNTLGFKYAKDKNRVYYRNLEVKYANPNTVTSVDETFDYVKDDKNAFYRTQLLPNVIVKTFQAVRTNYQIVYASDGKKHFVNGMEFPARVSNRFLGSTNVDTSNLVILEKAATRPKHLLFSDNKAIYYYDDQKNEFICAASLAGLKPFNNGGFTDGRFYYFTQTKNLVSRKIGSFGSQTNVYKTNLKFANASYEEKLAHAELILKIKTRRRTSFENENE